MQGFAPNASTPNAYAEPTVAAPSVILVGADLECAYSIDAAPVTFVGADLVCTYDIDAAPVVLVGADLVCSFDIDAASVVLVGADLICNYAILAGGSMSFEPSKARTVNVQATDKAFTATAPGFWIMTDPKKPKGLKDPNEQLDITFDWAAWLADSSDAILSYVVIVDGGLVNEGDDFTGSKVTVFVSAGTLGDAPITCRITTASTPPRTADRTVYMKIEER